jgi:hypothetical protein
MWAKIIQAYGKKCHGLKRNFLSPSMLKLDVLYVPYMLSASVHLTDVNVFKDTINLQPPVCWAVVGKVTPSIIEGLTEAVQTVALII